jgi:hypothetical protein
MKEPIEYKIASFYLPAIINGDYSGMEDEEEGMLNAFLQSVGTGVWSSGDEVGFALCEVTGLWSDCLEAKFYEDEV